MTTDERSAPYEFAGLSVVQVVLVPEGVTAHVSTRIQLHTPHILLHLLRTFDRLHLLCPCAFQ